MTVRRLVEPLGCTLAAVITFLSPAVLASPSAKLTYVRGVGAEQCPDEEHLRRAVSARLGYDPFFPFAKQTVVTEVDRAKTGYHARVRIIGENGVTRGERTLDTAGDDCAETLNALALAISIGIDDLEHVIPPPAVEVAPAASRAPATPPPFDFAELPSPDHALAEPLPGSVEGPLALERRSPRFDPFASARMHGAVGTAPAPAIGASLGVGLERGRFSFALEGRADLPATADSALGSVSSSLYVVSLVPCGHLSFASACALLTGGSFAYSGSNLSRPIDASAFFAAAGGRLAAEVALGSTLGAFAAADLLGTFTPHRVSIDAVDVYRMPTISAALGIGVAAHYR